MNNDGRVWNVYSYPDETVLHTADTYVAADQWRRGNNGQSFIAPRWPTTELAQIERLALSWFENYDQTPANDPRNPSEADIAYDDAGFQILRILGKV